MLGHACLGRNLVFLELYTQQNVGSQLSMHTFGSDGGYCLCVLRVKGVTTMGVVWQKKKFTPPTQLNVCDGPVHKRCR